MQDHPDPSQKIDPESSFGNREADILTSIPAYSSRPVSPGQVASLRQFDELTEKLNLAYGEIRTLREQHRDQARALRELTARTLVDPLTGLRNRRRFREDLESAWAYAIRHNLLLSSIVLDLDRFITFNAAFGEIAGDQVLHATARLLASGLRNYDVLARLRGGEFAILLPSTDRSEARRIAERLWKCVKEHDWPLRPITASFGVATLESTTISSRQLVDQSFQALRQAKLQGRNRVVHFFDLQNSSLAIDAEVRSPSRLEYLVQV